jgi:uncharacterized membrane protein
MTTTTVSTADTSPSLVRMMHIIYALHAFGLVLGAFSGSATVVGSFLGLTSIAAMVLSYIYRDDARGTWLESHFKWTMRTFWYALLWVIVVAVVSLPLALILVGFATWAIGLFVLGVWAAYRIARGWLRLNARQAMPT